MQRPKPAGGEFSAAKPAPNGPTYSVPEPPGGEDTQFVVAPQAGEPSGDESDYTTQRSEPAPQRRTALPLEQRNVRNAPVNPVPDGGRGGVDRVIQMANNGNPVALTILGLRALDGTNGSAVNLPDAVKFLTQAAEKGQAVAQYRLGTLYERGQGIPADAAKAAHWYELAANPGQPTRRCTIWRSPSPAARRAARTWPRRGAGSPRPAALGLSDSQFNLAVLYERGDGVPQSLVDAYKWYSIAAAAGDNESKSRLAVLQTQLLRQRQGAANKSAATFHAAPLNSQRNVPPEPADLVRNSLHHGCARGLTPAKSSAQIGLQSQSAP